MYPLKIPGVGSIREAMRSKRLRRYKHAEKISKDRASTMVKKLFMEKKTGKPKKNFKTQMIANDDRRRKLIETGFPKQRRKAKRLR